MHCAAERLTHPPYPRQVPPAHSSRQRTSTCLTAFCRLGCSQSQRSPPWLPITRLPLLPGWCGCVQEFERCHFFSSFFYKRLLREAKDLGVSEELYTSVDAVAEAYKVVKNWTKGGVDLSSKE